MARFWKRSSPLIAVTVLWLSIIHSDAFADRIGGSNLPASNSKLKGRLDDDSGPKTAYALGIFVGATTNAGPALIETASGFVDRSFTFVHARPTEVGQIALSVALSDRSYSSFDEADERSGRVDLSLTKDWGGQTSIVAMSASGGESIEERLTDAALSVTHLWTDEPVKPYVKAEVAVLDFGDLSDPVQPFRNQDDRDRVSSRAEAGLRWTIAENVEVEVGGGADSKVYLDARDDFGVRRDNVTPFAVLGVTRRWDKVSLSGRYMPFLRDFREPLFLEAVRHGYVIEGEAQLLGNVTAFVAAKHGFEETDFLIASTALETLVVAGVSIGLEGGRTLSVAASQSWRTYADLDLVDLARDDEKFEIAVGYEAPLFGAFSLSGRVSYLDYASSFGRVGTDALTASLGIVYAGTN